MIMNKTKIVLFLVVLLVWAGVFVALKRQEVVPVSLSPQDSVVQKIDEGVVEALEEEARVFVIVSLVPPASLGKPGADQLALQDKDCWIAGSSIV